MPGRLRTLPSLTGLTVTLALAGILAGGSGAASPPIYETVPVIHVTYAVNCTFAITVDGGITINSSTAPGVTIPPGTYQVSVRSPLPDNTFDPASCAMPLFQLTGPGVNYSTNLGGGSETGETTTVTLPPSSTYVAVDENYPATTQTVFSTAATGSTSSLILAYVPPAGTPTTTSTQSDVVGSAIVPYRGTLDATVAAPGKATLSADGKPVASIQAGRYDIVARDETSSGGLFVQKLTRHAETITGVSFTGKRTVMVDLTAGKWTFYSTRSRATPFVVTA